MVARGTVTFARGGPRTCEIDDLRAQIGALYRTDRQGRLLTFNDPADPPAPRCFLGRTRVGNLWRVRADLPAPLVSELELLCAAEPVADRFDREPRGAPAIRRLLSRHAPLEFEHRGPAFRFPDAVPEMPPSEGRIVAITEVSQFDLARAFPDLAATLGARQPCFGVISDGGCVSVCYSATRVPEADSPLRGVEAGVDTRSDCRGRGFAPRVVAAWAAELRRRGLVPLYGTQWTNAPSMSVARKLHLELYGEDFHLR